VTACSTRGCAPRIAEITRQFGVELTAGWAVKDG
jgi:hypothetical protein